MQFAVVWRVYVSCQVRGRRYDLDLWLVCKIGWFDICELVDVGLVYCCDSVSRERMSVDVCLVEGDVYRRRRQRGKMQSSIKQLL